MAQHPFVDHSDTLPSLPFRAIQVEAGPHKNFQYAFGDETGAALVDPTFCLDQTIAAARQHGLTPTVALFTHGHLDHIGGLPAVSQYGVRDVLVHEAAADHPKVIEGQAAGLRVQLLADGHTTEVGGVPVAAIHTPGHQPDSTCYVAGREGGPRLLFGGDTIFVSRSGRTDFPGGDINAMFASMARLRSLPGEIAVMAGHNYADRSWIWLSEAKRDNPALSHHQWEEFHGLPFLHGPVD